MICHHCAGCINAQDASKNIEVSITDFVCKVDHETQEDEINENKEPEGREVILEESLDHMKMLMARKMIIPILMLPLSFSFEVD